MRILLLFPMRDKQTGPAIKYAFNKLGHEVKAVDAKREWDQSHIVAKEYKPDLVFCSRTPALAEEVEKIKRIFPKIPTCAWNVDSYRDHVEGWKHLFPLIKAVDYYFVVGKMLIPEWRRTYNKNTFWLPQGVQHELYRKPNNISRAQRKEYSADVSFAGRIRHHKWARLHYWEAVKKMGVNAKIYGSLGVSKIWGEKHNLMSYLSKINLGMSFPVNGNCCVSVRDYKILGAGGFLMERQKDGLETLFPLGQDGIIDTYTIPENLIEKIRYWLTHDEKRKAMAEKAHKWVLSNATYIHRMKMALDYMRIS